MNALNLCLEFFYEIIVMKFSLNIPRSIPNYLLSSKCLHESKKKICIKTTTKCASRDEKKCGSH